MKPKHNRSINKNKRGHNKGNKPVSKPGDSKKRGKPTDIVKHHCKYCDTDVSLQGDDLLDHVNDCKRKAEDYRKKAEIKNKAEEDCKRKAEDDRKKAEIKNKEEEDRKKQEAEKTAKEQNKKKSNGKKE